MAIRRCCCCGRQLVSYLSNDDYTATDSNIRAVSTDEGFCVPCSEDLDDNGLFPEEREQAERIDRLGKL